MKLYKILAELDLYIQKYGKKQKSYALLLLTTTQQDLVDSLAEQWSSRDAIGVVWLRPIPHAIHQRLLEAGYKFPKSLVTE